MHESTRKQTHTDRYLHSHIGGTNTWREIVFLLCEVVPMPLHGRREAQIINHDWPVKGIIADSGLLVLVPLVLVLFGFWALAPRCHYDKFMGPSAPSCIGSPDVSRMAGPGPSYHQKAWLFWPLRSFLLRLAKGFVSSNRSGLACGASVSTKKCCPASVYRCIQARQRLD